jgi:hypothetical protein
MEHLHRAGKHEYFVLSILVTAGSNCSSAKSNETTAKATAACTAGGAVEASLLLFKH